MARRTMKRRCLFILIISGIIVSTLLLYMKTSDIFSHDNDRGTVKFRRIAPGKSVFGILKEHAGYQLQNGGGNVVNSQNLSDAELAAEIREQLLENNSVRFLSEQEKEEYLSLPENAQYTDRVAIVTLIRNAVDYLDVYAQNIKKLSYPKNLVNIYFGEDGSLDNTADLATEIAHGLKKDGFRQAKVIKVNCVGGVFGGLNILHAKGNQLARRGHIANVRNQLIIDVVTDVDWVLWMDVDVTYLPEDLIQQFLYAREDVMVTSCLIRGMTFNLIADMNSWRETEKSRKILDGMSENELMLEGYGPTYRKYLPHLRDKSRVVALDGVGGCALMIDADCHRNGLGFPDNIYKNHIDTEGLAKMASDMGFSVYGLPYVEVYQ